MNTFTVVFFLFCILHALQISGRKPTTCVSKVGAKHVDTESVVEGWSTIEEVFFGHDRALAEVAEDLKASTFGNQETKPGTCTIEDRLEKKFARRGDAFRMTTTSDASICALMCADTVQDCVAINYREGDKMCFFLAEPGYVDFAPGYTTALVNPSVVDLCNPANMIVGYGRPGIDLKGSPFKIPSATECCIFCYSTPECISYAYHTGKHRCYLKDYVPDLRRFGLAMTGLVCPAARA